jgi:hypothetical protein
MQHLDEGTIHAWLDGALTVEESARAEAHVVTCAKCADAVAEARGLIAASTRILTALDNVPNVRGAAGAGSAGGAARRPFLVTWLVRERLAAVVALVVAAGALAVVMSRPSEQFALLDTAIVPVAADEVLVRDTIPTSLPAPEPQQEGSTRRVAPGRGAVQGRPREQELSATRKAEAVPSMRVEMPTQVAVAQAPPPSLPTDDTVRGAVGAAAAPAPKDVQALSAEGKASRVEERLREFARRRDAAEAVEPFAAPRPQISIRGGNSIATQSAPNVTLLQEEQMKEGARDVRRRIYRVDDLLVTLDERAPHLLELERRRSALSADVVADTAVASVNTIQWTDARGFELSLSGAATKERLEQVRRALGY